jgi:hypothetical protein
MWLLGWKIGLVVSIVSVGIADTICTTDSAMQLTSAIIMFIVLIISYIIRTNEQKKFEALPEEEKKEIIKNNLQQEYNAITNKIDKLTRKNAILNNRLAYITNYNPTYNIDYKKEKADIAYNKQLRKYHEYHGGYGTAKSYHKAKKRYHRKEANYLWELEYERNKVRSYETETGSIIYQITKNKNKIDELKEKQAEILVKINKI